MLAFYVETFASEKKFQRESVCDVKYNSFESHGRASLTKWRGKKEHLVPVMSLNIFKRLRRVNSKCDAKYIPQLRNDSSGLALKSARKKVAPN